MTEIISKQELDELKELEGKVRGVGIKPYAKFILKEEGEEGLKKLEDAMARFGYPKYDELKSTEFYPLWFFAATMLTMQRLFNYSHEKFQEIGRYNAKFTILVRFFMKYFVSVDKAVKIVQKMWKKYYTTGHLKTIEYDTKKKYIILRLDFKLHHLHCQVIKGYFSVIVEMITKSKKVTCEEMKCVFSNDKYHEFLIRW